MRRGKVLVGWFSVLFLAMSMLASACGREAPAAPTAAPAASQAGPTQPAAQPAATQPAANQPAPTQAAAPKADPGITDTEVKLGSSFALSGPASAYGVETKAVQAYLQYVNNDLGGVKMADGKTRKINFVLVDDGYQTARTVENTRKLVEQEQVFAMFNLLGAAGNTAIWDYLEEKKVPNFFVITGASAFGADVAKHPETLAWIPAYSTEDAIYIEYLKKVKPNGKLAILYQNDEYGKDHYDSIVKAVQGTSLTIVAKESYETTDPTVDSQVTKLANSGADVFMNTASPKFAAQAIKKISETSWKPLHILVNGSASPQATLKPAGLENCQGIISSQYFKDPSDPQWDNDAAMKQYKELTKKYAPDFDSANPYGVLAFAVTQTMVKTLEQTKAPTRAAALDAARHLNNVRIDLLLPGITITTDGEKDGYPIEAMQLEEFKGDRYVLFGDVISYEGKTPH